MVMIIKRIKTYFSKYIDIDFFLRFCLLFMAMYMFNLFYMGITDKKGTLYSSFLANNFNYVLWVRNSILYTSNVIAHALGVNSYVYLPFHLKTLNGSWVDVAYGCLGFNFMSFWVAFVVVNKASLKRKILWSIAGIIGICFINSWRVAVLLMSFEHHWFQKVNSIVNHETIFNIAAYSLIAFMIMTYISSIKERKKAIEKAG
jgi:exosortase/archaeosortase family protein